jgi:8-oxo-dGTP pyrophosphatase MutT (NUDIX family)
MSFELKIEPSRMNQHACRSHTGARLTNHLSKHVLEIHLRSGGRIIGATLRLNTAAQRFRIAVDCGRSERRLGYECCAASRLQEDDVKPAKACPIVRRELAGAPCVLVFRHPQAGCQLVKGTIERYESPGEAAVRELLEEAGVPAQLGADLGTWQPDPRGPLWSFHVCEPVVPLAASWIYHCHDDGGHDFEFFWQPLSVEPDVDWHPVHLSALRYLRARLVHRGVHS